ncbi:MAG: ABC transporter permease [Christensenellaceae bacterium]|jgi:simple sugar transport system permease protein|nr:ABC transporter permease [Christensenellaceae bacterium]
MTKQKKEPLVRISKRTSGLPTWKAWGIRVAALAASLVVCALVIYAIVKMNPLKVYGAMFEGAFGTNKRIWVTIRDTMMLLCIAIGLAPAFKMRFWNIGAEGQILVGGIASAACMIYLSKTVTTLPLMLLMLALSIVAGAIWGFIPGLFKAKWNTNETLFTLMMNYIAIQMCAYFVALWENPFGSNTVGVINPQTRIGWFPKLLGQDYMLNVIIVLTLTVGMFIYLRYSKQGYEIAVVGESENTARYAAINVRKVIMRTMAISGAVCGIAGFLAVSGASHTISVSTAGGRGFTAIIVAWLAKFNTFVMILISALLIFLDKGSIEIASRYNLSNHVSNMLTGIILFFILGSEFFINYQVKFHHGSKREARA